MATTNVVALSRVATLGQEDTSVEWVFRVTPYEAHPRVCGLLLGGVKLFNGRLRRFAPARDPYMTWCYCQSIKVSPDDGAAPLGGVNLGINPLKQKISYPAAKLTCTYKAWEPDVPGDNDGTDDKPHDTNDQQEIDLASLSLDFGARQLPLPNDRFAWDGETGLETDKTLLLNEGVLATKTFPNVHMELVRHMCVNLPVLSIVSLMGRINRRPFKVTKNKQRVIWPAETLRFDGGHATRKTTSTGTKYWEISYRFSVMPIYDYIFAPNDANLKGVKDWVGWNRLLRPSTGAWAYVKTLNKNPKLQRTIYDYDEDLVPDPNRPGAEIPPPGIRKGFRLLFDPRAV